MESGQIAGMELIDLQQADDRRDAIVDVVARISQGEVALLALDAGAVLAASAHVSHAVAAIQRHLPDGQRLALAVKNVHEAEDYCPRLPRAARRLMSRCWPGTLDFDLPFEAPEGLFSCLPKSVQLALAGEGRLRLSSPRKAYIREMQKLLSGPLVLTSPVGADTLSADWEASRKAPPVARLVVTDGPIRFPEGNTVVRISATGWELERPGAISSANLKRMSGTVFLFVCTGNTCRSPMAEGLFRKLVAQKLSCSEEDLSDRGVLVLSAGISAGDGAPAAPEAVELLLDHGVDISDHSSQQLTEDLLERADYVFTMTRSHREMVINSRPDLAERIAMLSPEGRDVADPIGGGLQEYEACKREIEGYLADLLTRIDLTQDPT